MFPSKSSFYQKDDRGSNVAMTGTRNAIRKTLRPVIMFPLQHLNDLNCFQLILDQGWYGGGGVPVPATIYEKPNGRIPIRKIRIRKIRFGTNHSNNDND